MEFFKRYFIFICLLLSANCSLAKKSDLITCQISFFPEIIEPPDTSYLEYVFGMYPLVNIKTIDSSIQVHLRYADTNNFLHRDFYDGLRNAYFTCYAAIKLSTAQYYIKQVNQDYSLLILDAARPLHIQQMMWDSIRLPEEKKYKYLTPASVTSMHNYGVAVDLTVVDIKTGKPLDMGTDFDHFGDLSQPLFEEEYLQKNKLTKEQVDNRKLLRKAMKSAGFKHISSEWWHFVACPREKAVSQFELIK